MDRNDLEVVQTALLYARRLTLATTLINDAIMMTRKPDPPLMALLGQALNIIETELGSDEPGEPEAVEQSE